jgi:hypothetical protein
MWVLLISDFVHVFGIFIDEKSIFIDENDIILTVDYVRHAAGRLLVSSVPASYHYVMTLRNYIYKTKKIRLTHIFAVASKASALQWCKLANSIEDHYIGYLFLIKAQQIK